MNEPFQHRPTGSKQTNKSFKSRHKSKGQLKKSHGKEQTRKENFKQKNFTETRNDRKNKAKQMKLWKKNNVLQEKRFLQKSMEGPPLCVAIIALGSTCNLDLVVKLLVEASESDKVSVSQTGVTTVFVPRFKSRCSFYKVQNRDVISTIDITKVADIILFVINCTEGIDEGGNMTLTLIKSQGLLSSMTLYQGVEDIPIKKRNENKKKI